MNREKDIQISVRLGPEDQKNLKFIMDELGIKKKTAAIRAALMVYSGIVAKMK